MRQQKLKLTLIGGQPCHFEFYAKNDTKHNIICPIFTINCDHRYVAMSDFLKAARQRVPDNDYRMVSEPL